ncbi:hypothetical protein BAUCODRAFT_333205 [Baudoinia panamericana UAMH 10762]|uniref:Uncharacterized protein n=1 Tax=Baudoinia panamericana (strain UAMH 10762) TaxID=717646 RepID=M2MXQ7_BAUPA|nr:uncharacterized protein BAUCODRAFT_333205 [Baudoinia panamericana UAMH 10762]EMC91020.1 hypothetical protein BAUCODRAFT_333205 [Baudoinia panamericana UAMH 10762]
MSRFSRDNDITMATELPSILTALETFVNDFLKQLSEERICRDSLQQALTGVQSTVQQALDVLNDFPIPAQDIESRSEAMALQFHVMTTLWKAGITLTEATLDRFPQRGRTMSERIDSREHAHPLSLSGGLLPCPAQITNDGVHNGVPGNPSAPTTLRATASRDEHAYQQLEGATVTPGTGVDATVTDSIAQSPTQSQGWQDIPTPTLFRLQHHTESDLLILVPLATAQRVETSTDNL